jgi:hypothetical protein
MGDNHPDGPDLAPAPVVVDWQARTEAAEAALAELEKQASETSRRGAVTGPHWAQLSIAILKARAILAAEKEPRHE